MHFLILLTSETPIPEAIIEFKGVGDASYTRWTLQDGFVTGRRRRSIKGAGESAREDIDFVFKAISPAHASPQTLRH